jgi:hypothetical protein
MTSAQSTLGVDAGQPVAGSRDGGGPGLVGADFLVSAFDSTLANPEGEWSAVAQLKLMTELNPVLGRYSADLTLTLMEDES